MDFGRLPSLQILFPQNLDESTFGGQAPFPATLLPRLSEVRKVSLITDTSRVFPGFSRKVSLFWDTLRTSMLMERWMCGYFPARLRGLPIVVGNDVSHMVLPRHAENNRSHERIIEASGILSWQVISCFPVFYRHERIIS